MAGTCRGIDVSAYQSSQDWQARKAEGIVFAFAKASEGQHTKDAKFSTHIAGIKKAGLVPGAYHYGWPTQDVALEAANYIAAVKLYVGPGFIHWLDLERSSTGANYAGRTAAQIKAWAARWMALVGEAFPGQRVGIYTSGSDLSADHVPAGTTVWYPAYTWGYRTATYAQAEAAARPHPSGWSPLFWQFTSTPLDRSICYLSEAGLRTWAANTTEENALTLTKQDIYDAVWKTDAVTAPADSPDVATNPTWQPQSFIKDIDTRVRGLEKSLAVVSAANSELVKAVASLASGVSGLDPATIVAELKTAIEGVTVRLDATP